MKKPYSDKSDIEKIESNWKKTLTLFRKRQYSGAMVRAATGVELAVNLVIREEYQTRRKLEKDLVDSFLLWANGIQGKFDRLIIPSLKGSPNEAVFKKLKNRIDSINKKRNLIVHSGQFQTKGTAKTTIHSSKEVIETLVQPYTATFKLKDIDCK